MGRRRETALVPARGLVPVCVCVCVCAGGGSRAILGTSCIPERKRTGRMLVEGLGTDLPGSRHRAESGSHIPCGKKKAGANILQGNPSKFTVFLSGNYLGSCS